jgi:ribosomal protein S18 acetylase RimI-like enzyme
MNGIIEIYKGHEHDSQIKDLVISAFQTKFNRLSSLNRKELMQLLNLFWFFPSCSSVNKQIVIKDRDKVCATMLLRGNNEKQYRKINYLLLIRKYGLKNVVKIIAGLSVLEYSVKEKEYYIDHLAVAENYRGQGLGKELIMWAQNYIDLDTNLTLIVAADNIGAITLYKKLGFNIVHQQKSFLTGFFFGKDAWYLMEYRRESSTL